MTMPIDSASRGRRDMIGRTCGRRFAAFAVKRAIKLTTFLVDRLLGWIRLFRRG